MDWKKDILTKSQLSKYKLINMSFGMMDDI